MRRIISSALALAAIMHASGAMACGLKGAPIPVGTPIQEATISNRDRPTMGFGANQAAVVRASIVARPCHGTLTVLNPPGFRYVPAPGFVGVDMYATKGCRRDGQCAITGAVVTVTP